MENLKYIQCITDNIVCSLIGFLLTNHDIQYVSFSDFEIEKDELHDILALSTEINAISKRYFTIQNTSININKNLIKLVKPFLHEMLTRIVAPQESVYSLFPVIIFGIKLITENYPPINYERMKKSKIYAAYVKRYVTHDGYSPDTLNFFNNFIHKIYSMNVSIPSLSVVSNIQKFENIISSHNSAWALIISNLINGSLKARDYVTDYFWYNKQTLTDIELLNSIEDIPALVYIENNNILISPTFFENKFCIIPYFIALIDFVYMPKKIEHILLFSSLQSCKKRAV